MFSVGQRIASRFKILRELGKGGQGAVYLAQDQQLDRQVAIKTLLRAGHDSGDLINEARMVSKLQHPNIITLFDAGEFQQIPYLVYEYVAGQTLAQTLNNGKQLALVKAAETAIGILAGLECAHQQQIVHLDIKPANIMLTSSGIPMVMDFGLAKVVNESDKPGEVINGTPRYVAPELVQGQQGTRLSDLYSVGTLLYEMVTSHYAIPGNGVYEVLNRVVHYDIARPSEYNPDIDEALEMIILKVLSRDPAGRYESAAQMKQALMDYLGDSQENQVSADPVTENSTLGFLLRRMRTKKDFPAISGNIAEINRIVKSEETSASRLSSAILQDYSLTSKLLKLVNAATYGQFGGKINTVSKAVVVLGFETVRSIASSLILIEFLQNRPQAERLKEEIASSILTSVVAAQLSVGKEIRDAEEVMVCSMFHNLGRLLVMYYFFEESQEIDRLVTQGMNEDSAAIKVLGIAFHELGEGVARHWNFSHRMIQGMRRLKEIEPPEGELDTLALTVNLSNELCDVARSSQASNKQQHLSSLVKRYSGALAVSTADLSKALDRGLDDFSKRVNMLGIKLGRVPILKKVRDWNGKPEAQETGQAEEAAEQSIGALDKTLTAMDAAEMEDRPVHDPETVLSAGIQDVTNSLVSDFKLNDVLQMILETIFRGMGFNRAVLLIRDKKRQAMVAKYGFGENVEQIMSSFAFPLAYEPDVFHLSVAKGLDIAIDNTKAPNIQGRLPLWYWSLLNAPCFLLLPARVNDKTICMFYADKNDIKGLNTSKQQLSLLRTLRNQAVLAIKQKI